MLEFAGVAVGVVPVHTEHNKKLPDCAVPVIDAPGVFFARFGEVYMQSVDIYIAVGLQNFKRLLNGGLRYAELARHLYLVYVFKLFRKKKYRFEVILARLIAFHNKIIQSEDKFVNIKCAFLINFVHVCYLSVLHIHGIIFNVEEVRGNGIHEPRRAHIAVLFVKPAVRHGHVGKLP